MCPASFSLENSGRAEGETAFWMGWGKSGVALRQPPHSKACLAKRSQLKCPRPATDLGEMLEGKIVGKNENNILIVRSA